MKRTILMLLVLLCGMISYSQVSVKSYYKSNGTYVQPHERTPPNSTITDNYSYPGNYNPNTGKVTSSYSSVNTSSKYAPDEKRMYLKNQSGESYGYVYPENAYSCWKYHVYDMNDKLLYSIYKYPHGGKSLYNAKGEYVSPLN